MLLEVNSVNFYLIINILSNGLGLMDCILLAGGLYCEIRGEILPVFIL